MFDFKDNRYTHMPFAVNDRSLKPEEFCCIRNDDGLWKLHHFDGENWVRMNTGLPEDFVECGPTAELVGDQWHISFIAGGSITNPSFSLYVMYGLNGEVIKQCSADVGFVWKGRVCHAYRQGAIKYVDHGRTITISIPTAEYLYRVSYNPNDPNELLISGKDKNGDIFSWSYKPILKKLRSILTDGVPAYKCAQINGLWFYAQRENGFEDRHIVKASSVIFTPLSAEEYITETIAPNTISNIPEAFE